MKKDELTEKGFVFIAKGYKPLCATERGLLFYHRHALYLYDVEHDKFCKFISFTYCLKDKLKEISRLMSRAFRTEPYSGEVFHDILFVARKHEIVQISMKQGAIISNDEYRKPYIHLRKLTPIIGVEGFKDCMAYGEYFSNSKHESVNVYTTVQIGEKLVWRVAYTFPNGIIRHIHSLVPDVKNRCVYILTGDTDSESGIWKATDGFKTVTPLLAGDQNYRAGTAFVNEDAMFYATDMPSRQNAIIKVDVTNGRFMRICDFPGSCTSACKMADRIVFCSTVEPTEPKNRKKGEMLKYYLRNDVSSGIKDRCPRICIEKADGSFAELLKCEKDIWPGAVFQFGRVIPSYDPFSEMLYLYFIGVKKFDGKVYAVSKSKINAQLG